MAAGAATKSVIVSNTFYDALLCCKSSATDVKTGLNRSTPSDYLVQKQNDSNYKYRMDYTSGMKAKKPN